MREGERLEKQWGDEKVREGERLEKCKYEIKKIINNYKKMEKKKDDDVDVDVDVDVAQRERSSIKRYASAFSNILICVPLI